MDDLIKSMKAHLYDRVSSPLMFSFLCSWTIWNYRLLIIVLSGADPEKKFAQIEALPTKSYVLHLFPALPPEAYWLCIGILGPLLTTLFYLFVLPWFEAKALKVSMEKSVELKGIKLKAENATPIDENERIHLRGLIRASEEARDAAVERQRLVMQKIVDEKQAELVAARNEAGQRHMEASNTQTLMQNEINTLKQAKESLELEKDNLETKLKEAERLTTVVFGLEEGARKLMKTWNDRSARKFSELTRYDPKVKHWFDQLHEGGLATLYDDRPRLSPQAERILLDYQLSQRSSEPFDASGLVSP